MNQIQELWTPVFPARTTRKLRYSTSVSLSSASGAVASYVFSANGLFDPDITSTGHQPMGFDQMMLSYNHYAVTSAKLIATFRNTTTTASSVSISVSPDSTPRTEIERILEFGMLNKDTLEFKGVTGSIKTLESACSIKKVQGVRDVVDVVELQGNSAANPVEQTYFHVQMWDAAGGTGSATVDILIEYNAVFMEPRVLSQSVSKALSKLIIADEKAVGPSAQRLTCAQRLARA